MNTFTVAFFALVAVAAAGVVPSPGSDVLAETLRSESVVNPDSHQWAYETSNGIAAEERGQVKQVSQTETGYDTQGSYRYTAPDGQVITVTYVADENGFQPQGAHLPVAPAVPEAIVRALEWIAAHPHREEQH